MVRTQVQLTEEQASSLKQLAAKRQVSIACLIRESVEQLLREAVSVSRSELRERALKAAGRFRSGGLNLSEKHDEYFVEAIEQGHKK
jgi:predicted transcriptional regulator